MWILYFFSVMAKLATKLPTHGKSTNTWFEKVPTVTHGLKKY